MITRTSLPKYNSVDPIQSKDLNKLRDEVQRLGRIRSSAPVQVISDCTGITIGLTGYMNNLCFAQLTQQVNQNESGLGEPFTIDASGNWIVDTNTKNQIKCYAPPTLAYQEYYPANIIVTVIYIGALKRWVIISSPYCTC